jgi:hypothetical protein
LPHRRWHGSRYQPGLLYPTATISAHNSIVTLDDPAARWICAVHLVREITACTIVDLDDHAQSPIR